MVIKNFKKSFRCCSVGLMSGVGADDASHLVLFHPGLLDDVHSSSH